MFSSPTNRTMTSVTINVVIINARSSIPAWHFVALGFWNLTIGTSETVGANASIIVDAVDTSSTVQTRRLGTIFIIDLAVGSRETFFTSASIGIDVVVADSSILTRLGRTFVDVDLANVSSEPIYAQTFESVSFIKTSATVQARFVCRNVKKLILYINKQLMILTMDKKCKQTCTIVSVDQTIPSFETISTMTSVASRSV